MRALRIAAALGVVAGTLSFATPAAAAGAPEVGWWWKAQSGVLTSVPAPHVEDGQFAVAGAPDGATAIAALRWELAEDEGAPKLTLQVARGEETSTPVLAACRTGSFWHPAHAGSWSSKPLVSCDAGSVKGERAQDGKSWTFDLTSLLDGTTLDIALVPGVVEGRPAGANGSVFQLVFKEPDASALTTTTESSFSDPMPPPSGDSGFGSDFGSGSDTSGFGSDETFGATTSLPEPDVARSTPFTPSLPENEQSPVAAPPAATRPPVELAADVPAPLPQSTEGQILAFAVLLAAGAVATWATLQPTPAARGLGRLAGATPRPVVVVPLEVEPEEGGLGRFRRLRVGPPPGL